LGTKDASQLAGVYAGLATSVPDLERRDTIVISGKDKDGVAWVGCCGYYCGTFSEAWYGIRPTGHLVGMRFHEFFRIDGDKVVEVQAIWDIPHLMMQAGQWPMAPSLGLDWQVPGPATQDGLGPHANSDHTKLILDMLTAMSRHPSEGGPDVMEMDRFWHKNMSWYGPSGIGTCRGIEGFRNWHQIPFLKAMPDRGQNPKGTKAHFFGEGNYVAVTGWPNMRQTITGDGWLGIAPSGQDVTLRSLDFWRVENGIIRENWVLVDLLDMFAQIGVDVLGRMRDLNKMKVQ
jgi:predicted ester cyclase